MELRVEKIASIDFRHNYFVLSSHDWKTEWPDSYPESEIPLVTPSLETERKLADAGLYFKKSNGGFNLFAQIKEEAGKYIAERKVKHNQVLCFYASAPNPSWNQYTKGGEIAGGLTVYSNLNGFKSAGTDNTLYLHDSILNAGPGDKSPGTLVRKNNHVYESVEKTNTEPNGNAWVDLGIHTNFSALDKKIEINRGILVVEQNSLAGAVVEIKDVYNTIVWSYTFDSASTEQSRSLDISELSEGIYTWQLNAVEQESFLVCSNEPQGAFGLVMLYLQPHQAIIPSELRLAEEWLPIANGTGSLDEFEINPRHYVIHFLANRAKWKYIFNRDLSLPINDVPADYDKLDNTIYQSKTAKAITKLETGPDFGLDQPLPAATAGILLPQFKGGSDVESYVKEIYVNV